MTSELVSYSSELVSWWVIEFSVTSELVSYSSELVSWWTSDILTSELN